MSARKEDSAETVFKTITMHEEIYLRLDKLREKRQSELDVDLSWNAFMKLVAKELEERSR